VERSFIKTRGLHPATQSRGEPSPLRGSVEDTRGEPSPLRGSVGGTSLPLTCRNSLIGEQVADLPVIDLFDNSVSCQTSSPIFQAKALQKYFAVVV
jgi:hypothetical protein